MALAMLLVAIGGGASHVRRTRGVWPKARLATSLAYLFFTEIFGFLAFLPSVSRSLLLYSSLPAAARSDPTSCHVSPSGGHPEALSRRPRVRSGNRVCVDRNIRYGKAKRNLLDVYLPAEAPVEEAVLAETNGSNGSRPVVVFVHGGIWATGSKELFSNLGVSLASHGVITLILQYTLFPEALASQQAREVSSALTWAMDNVEEYGGNPRKISLMGHSSGAHVAAVAVWERFKGQHSQQHSDSPYVETRDVRQPWQFMGLAGVYDIVDHLAHEEKRGVASLSCMTQANGTLPHSLEAMSPVRLFRRVLDEHDKASFHDMLPEKFTLMCSRGDIVVPPDTSWAFHGVLLPLLSDQHCRILSFESLKHRDFLQLDGTLPESIRLRDHILLSLRQ